MNYVKNKAALFALQDHSSRIMYNAKGKTSKTRSLKNKNFKKAIL